MLFRWVLVTALQRERRTRPSRCETGQAQGEKRPFSAPADVECCPTAGFRNTLGLVCRIPATQNVQNPPTNPASTGLLYCPHQKGIFKKLCSYSKAVLNVLLKQMLPGHFCASLPPELLSPRRQRRYTSRFVFH